MRHTKLTVALAATVLGSLWMSPAECQADHRQRAQGYYSYSYSPPVGHYPSYGARRAAMQSQQGLARRTKGYPYLGAPLYPCPKQDIPHQVGGTVITNRAFDPHEMLYAHEYRSLYAPYYYKVKGSWIWTPFGIESHDKWELIGTEVKVKYSSRQGLLSSFYLR